MTSHLQCTVIGGILIGMSVKPAAAALPFAYDWSKFPAAWFGGNATNFENATQLDAIAQYSMAVFGWQHLIFATNWTASIYAQLDQAAILKAHAPKLILAMQVLAMRTDTTPPLGRSSRLPPMAAPAISPAAKSLSRTRTGFSRRIWCRCILCPHASRWALATPILQLTAAGIRFGM